MPVKGLGSEYMRWVKSSSQSRYNLVSSDLHQLPLAELGLTIDELEVNGPGGYGFPPLLSSIANKCACDERCVVPSVGTSLANHIAMAALIEAGDEVLLEHPTYPLIADALNYLGARVTLFQRRPENAYAVDTEELRRLVNPSTKLIVLTNLHNPTSAFIGENVLTEIGRIASRAGARVLIDEVYLDAVSPTPRSAFHLGEEFVTTSSLTKVYGLSGLRCGWILAAPPLADRMRHLTDIFHSTHAHPAELISVRALARLGVLLERSRSILVANTKLINDFFRGCDVIESPVHVHGLVAYPKYLGPDIGALYDRLRNRYETTVAPGSFFGLHGHFRIAIGKETPYVREALAQLAKGLGKG